MEKIIISCLESRVETNRSIYARFLLGPFKDDNAVTIATALRRSLLSKVKSIAITAIHIQGVTHEFSTIVGVRESVLDLALNFQQVVLRTKTDKQAKRFYEQNSNKQKQSLEELESKAPNPKDEVVLESCSGKESKTKSQNVISDKTFYSKDINGAQKQSFREIKAQTAQIGYLQMQGPAVVYANDLQLPMGVECVDPTQYIATLSSEGLLVIKFLIGEKKASLEINNDVLTGKKVVYVPKRSFQQGKPEQGSGKEQSRAKTSFLQDNAQDRKAVFKLGNGHFKMGSKTFTQNTAGLSKSTSSLKEKDSANRVYNDNNDKGTIPILPTFRSFDPTICLRNTIFLDPIFDSVFQANYIIEKDDLFNQSRERIVLEFWTNGSVHPRQALHQASLSLISTFSIFRKVFHFDSL